MAGPGAGEPAMEDERSFSDICGGRLALHRRYYSPSCLEFCLSCPRISLRSLTAVTCTVWLAAYGLFTLCEVRPASESGLGFGRIFGVLGSSPELSPDRPTVVRPGGQKLAGFGDAIPLLDSSLPSLTLSELCAHSGIAALCAVVPLSLHLVLARQPKTLTSMCSV